MLSLAVHVRIDVHLPPTDLRKSFDGLTGLVRSAFQADARDGSWFLFFNHRRDRVKILAWEPDGYSSWDKRLESGTFETLRAVVDGQSRELDSTELALLLSGVSIQTAQRRRRFFSVGLRRSTLLRVSGHPKLASEGRRNQYWSVRRLRWMTFCLV